MHQSSNRTNPQLSTVEYVLCLLFPVMLSVFLHTQAKKAKNQFAWLWALVVKK